MYRQMGQTTADYQELLYLAGSDVMPITGDKKQILHEFDDGTFEVVSLSDSFFDVEVKFNYRDTTDMDFVIDLFHDSAKANGRANTFYWYNPLDNYAYTARFLTPMKAVYQPGLLQSIDTIRMRINGYFGQAYSTYTDMSLYVESDTYMFFI